VIVPNLAGRTYVPKTYPVQEERTAVVDVIERGIIDAGARLIYSSFRHEHSAPMYFGAETAEGHRFGLLIYPFTTTRRETRNRPAGERRTQIRFGDPTREREEANPVAHDLAGVDITLILAVDPENDFIVGLDPAIYADLPMGISVYYADKHVDLANENDWAVWERKKAGGTRRPSWEGLETIVGFRPRRILDYSRFEAKASALGLSPELRGRLAEEFATAEHESHRLEELFDVDADTILGIIEDNFRLGVAVRGGVAEHHLARSLKQEGAVLRSSSIDEDGKPDFDITVVGNVMLTVECKTASKNRYANGDYKVEIQKTRDSGAGRKYTYDQFDIIAACLFSATGLWEFRYRWTRDLEPWKDDPERIKAVHRIDSSWASSIEELLT